MDQAGTSHGPDEFHLHATAVSVDGRGLLLTGPSGSGKSSLALQMMAFGADLVADDQVCVTPLSEGGLKLSAPEPTKGLIEARGVGLIMAPVASAYAVAVVDLSQTETERLPSERETVIGGVRLPLLKRVETPAFAAILMNYLKSGRAQR